MENTGWRALAMIMYWDLIEDRTSEQLSYWTWTHPWQAMPGDWGTASFFEARHVAMLELEAGWASMSDTTFRAGIKRRLGMVTRCPEMILSDEVFDGIQSLVRSVPHTRLCRIASHLIRDMDERSLGMPDLAVWVESDNVLSRGSSPLVCVEVKTTDRLSRRQQQWGHRLCGMGIPAGVLRVRLGTAALDH